MSSHFTVLSGTYRRLPLKIRWSLERFRHKYIVTEWGWRRPSINGRETDRFDRRRNTHHIVVLEQSTRVVGYVRLTRGQKFEDLMLGTDFSQYMNGIRPNIEALFRADPNSMVEASRFLVRLDHPNANEIANKLFAEIAKWCLAYNIHYVEMVTTESMIRALKRRGGDNNSFPVCHQTGEWWIAVIDTFAFIDYGRKTFGSSAAWLPEVDNSGQ